MLLILLALARIYHVVAVANLKASASTHVEVAGKVSLVKKEDDGDWHIRIADARGRFIVAEIIPTLQPFAADTGTILPFGPPPKVGDCVRVRGIRRIDDWPHHGWAEVHPVEELAVVPCR